MQREPIQRIVTLIFYIVVNDSEKDMIGLAAQVYKSIRHKQSRSVDIIVGTESRFEERKMLLHLKMK